MILILPCVNWIITLREGCEPLFHMPEYPLACWWDEWPEPRVPLGEAQMKYASKPVPEGAKFRNAPLLAAGIGILRVCHLLIKDAYETIARMQFNALQGG